MIEIKASDICTPCVSTALQKSVKLEKAKCQKSLSTKSVDLIVLMLRRERRA